MAPVYFSRSQAANAAIKKGLIAFETFQPITHADKNCWTYEERADGPGIQYAKIFAENRDWIHHVEVTDKLIPILVVTCFREEIIEEIPALFKVEPITPELWEANRREYPDARKYRLQKVNGHALPHGSAAVSPVASGKLTSDKVMPQKRLAGATAICRELMAENPDFSKDKAGFVAACMERGVILATAQTQWYRLK